MTQTYTLSFTSTAETRLEYLNEVFIKGSGITKGKYTPY